MPRTDEKFLEWAKNLYDYAEERFKDWGVPSPQTAWDGLLADYEAAFMVVQLPNRGRVDVLAKNEARSSLQKAVRVYVRAYLASNPAVTDVERVAMGITVRKTGKTPVPTPKTVPKLTVDTDTVRLHKVHYRDQDSTHRGKPPHVFGIEIRHAILDHYPASVDELIHADFDTASPFEKVFGEADRGKRVYYCGRWEAVGKKGLFGEIAEAVVP
jgi:hypothetical protein